MSVRGAARGAGLRPRSHVPDRQAAYGVPLRRGADVAPSIGCQWEQGRAASREDADAEDGDRGALPASAHDKPEPGHKIYPYLLRGVEIMLPNQVWAMDITYVPMAKGFGVGRGLLGLVRGRYSLAVCLTTA